MEWLLEKDGQLLLWLREMVCHPALDDGMRFISKLGDHGTIWIIIACLFLLMGFWKKVWFKNGLLLAFSLLADLMLCNKLLKPLFDRTRPYYVLGYEPLIAPVGDPSFPSGHTAVSFAAATAIYAINKKWGIAAYIFAAVMGFSRLYLGVHFPLDVLGGAVVGIVAAKLVLMVFARFDRK